MDLTLKFITQKLVDEIESSLGGAVEDGEVLLLNLESDLLDGTHIVGEDIVSIKNKGKDKDKDKEKDSDR